MSEIGGPGGMEWWWPHTKSELAAKLIERYHEPLNGDRSMVLKVETKNDAGVTNGKAQVKSLKKALDRLGYRLCWRVRDGHIVGWASPVRPNAVKPPPKRKVDKPAILPDAPR